jgi:fructose-1,6-bisphosphatase/inositol monophosphatase family enzyme
MLESLMDKIKEILLSEVKDIIMTARTESMIVVEEKGNGDSATIADVKIGELFSKILPELLPNSIVINEEDFCEEVFEKMKTTRYIWIVDPIDGTKAFRTPNNNEYCVGIGLLDNLKPVLSLVYLPEYEFKGEKGLMFESIDTEEGAKLNGRNILVNDKDNLSELLCINHIHRDTELNEIEDNISSKCGRREKIRAYEGHSTLANYALVVADNLNRIFTRRNANIWDVEQSAYIVEKAGGVVFYNDGTDIFPLDLNRLKVKVDENGNNFLIIDSNIACAKTIKTEILSLIK